MITWKRVAVTFILILCYSTIEPLKGEAKLLYHGLAEADVSQKWRVSESTHFQYIFPLHLRDLTHLISIEAEKVFQELSSWTGYIPPKKIDILITDGSDLANGFVKLGSKGWFVKLYTVHPYTSQLSIDAYRSWYKNLLIHELTHYFHMDTVGGFPLFLKRIFGNIFYPNALTPPLYREGLATYAETVHESGFGRGNSPYSDMYLRTAYMENNFPPLDRAVNNTTIWPLGNTHYHFGVSFLNYLSEHYGEEKILQFNAMSSRSPIYLWGIPFRKVYDLHLHDMWQEWEKFEKNRQKAFLETLMSDSVTSFTPIGAKLGYIHSHCFDSTGTKIAYSLNPLKEVGGLYIYDLQSKSNKRIKRGIYAWNLQFSQDTEHLYYIRYDIEKNMNYKKNIYKLDIKGGKEKKITNTGGIQSFVLLEEPDEFIVCFSTPYGTEIGWLNSKGEILKKIKSGADETQRAHPLLPVIDEPAVSPDMTLVAFSCKNLQGERGIYTASLSELREGYFNAQRITPPGYNAYSPRWISSEEIIFVGDDNGVYNLYMTSMHSGLTSRITNVTRGVFSPSVSRDGKITVTEYTSEGFRVAYTSITNLSLNSGSSSVDVDSEKKDGPTEYTLSSPEIGSISMEKYSPGRWLAPAYWLPVWSGENIGLGLGFYTRGYDLLKKHSYDAALVYDVLDSQIKSELNYTHRTWPFSYFVSFFMAQEPDTASFSPSIALYPGISFLIQKKKYLIQTDFGLISESPYFGPDALFFFSNTERPVRWIGPERGFYFYHDIYYNSISDNFTVVSNSFSQYFKLFDFILLNINIRSRGGWGDLKGVVRSGSSSKYVYVPLDGVLTLGYPDPVSGRFVSDLKIMLGTPLLTVNRGIQALPLFFEGINLHLYSDNGIIVSDSSSYNFVITDAHDFFSDPFQYIRSSAGVEIQLASVIGYEIPLAVNFGYVYPLSKGGRSGIYITSHVSAGF